MVEANKLFKEVVARSGLARLFAANTLARAFSRAGVDVRTLDRAGLKKALPSIRTAISLYLPPDEIEQKMRLIEELLH